MAQAAVNKSPEILFSLINMDAVAQPARCKGAV